MIYRTWNYMLFLTLSLGFIRCSNPSGENFIPSPEVKTKVDIVPLAIGAPAPDFRLPGEDGIWYSLDDFDKKVLVVAFLSNHCPYSQVYEERLIEFYNIYQNKDVDLVAISPNSPLAVPDDAMGYSDLDDTYESMKIRAQDRQFNFPYLYDGDQQLVSIAYGPPVTPTVYIFDEDRNLQYRGRIDYSPFKDGANAEDLRLSVDAVLRGGEIIRRERDSQGCEVYWSWKQQGMNALALAWEESPVRLQKINLDSLKTVLVNFSGKPRVINFWATWCGPCKLEFPEFLRMRRMYRHRPVEFISVCLDETKDYDKALAFLQQLHAPGINYFLTEEDKEEIREKVYDEWDGTLPFTMIVEPFGIPYKIWSGPFDPVTVRKAIVEYRLLGRYLTY